MIADDIPFLESAQEGFNCSKKVSSNTNNTPRKNSLTNTNTTTATTQNTHSGLINCGTLSTSFAFSGNVCFILIFHYHSYPLFDCNHLYPIARVFISSPGFMHLHSFNILGLFIALQGFCLVLTGTGQLVAAVISFFLSLSIVSGVIHGFVVALVTSYCK